jgi:RHS repeat-associated protein
LAVGKEKRTMKGIAMKNLLTALLGLLLFSGYASAQRVEYYHLDALGSVRAVTDDNGDVITRHDYMPYGEEWNPPASSNTLRFTGQERDNETGLDYFGARYYDTGIGIFTVVDPAMTMDANLVDPQRWNRYAYARANPFVFVDLDGREIRYAGAGVEAFFNALAARSVSVRATLALYDDADEPSLLITQGAIAADADDGPIRGRFDPNYGAGPTTDDPPGSGDFSNFAGMSDAEVHQSVADGSAYTSATLSGGTITISNEFALNAVSARGNNRNDREAVGVALHELGHADDAVRNPLAYFRSILPANQLDPRGGRVPHDERGVERNAIGYATGAQREIN